MCSVQRVCGLTCVRACVRLREHACARGCVCVCMHACPTCKSTTRRSERGSHAISATLLPLAGLGSETPQQLKGGGRRMLCIECALTPLSPGLHSWPLTGPPPPPPPSPGLPSCPSLQVDVRQHDRHELCLEAGRSAHQVQGHQLVPAAAAAAALERRQQYLAGAGPRRGQHALLTGTTVPGLQARPIHTV